jgi:hypothetical protein
MMSESKKNYFEELYGIDVNEKTEKKGNLTYLSWAWAWAEIKKKHPDANYTIYENKDGWNYHTDGKTAWVKTGVTVAGIEHIEYLPVMDFKNKSIPLSAVTSFDVNKTIQRALTKACARHGLGLYIYAGEDLPEEPPKEYKCEECGTPFQAFTDKSGKKWNSGQVYHLAESSAKKAGVAGVFCSACLKKKQEAKANDA